MHLIIKCFKHSIRSFSARVPTIFALSSGQGKCGVAVIRVSGPKAKEAIFKMTKCTQLPAPRLASLHWIRDPETQEELDKGLVIWFPGPRSFTGEDSCEFQVHGGPAVIGSVLAGLSKIPEFRLAEPGDFTKRAFYAGKLDLTEVEGLGDLIHSETNLQRKQALYQMEGNLGQLYKKWREVLVQNLAHIEAYIDFSEDDNIEDNILENIQKNLDSLRNEIKAHLSDGRKGERLRDGIQTAIIGEPNAGKSSLLNALSQKPAAIVTPIPGTTRDIIETHININGFPITLLDTAGLRADTTSIVEKEGILRAHATLEKSDLILFVIDVKKMTNQLISLSNANINKFLKNHMQNLNLECNLKNLWNYKSKKTSLNCIFVFNKSDLLNNDERKKYKTLLRNKHYMNLISCSTEEGFIEFLDNLSHFLMKLCNNPSKEHPTLTNSRHRYHLNESLKFLNEYFMLSETDVTLSAQKLRLCVRHIGKIIGTVSTDEILDIIFKDFCIGK